MKAVILAAGLGTRMRKADESAQLSGAQALAAATGVKALIPIGSGLGDRPFLDYVLTALTEAGYGQVCLVIGPDHHQVRDYYTKQNPAKRIKLDFAIQAKPLGTANAAASAEAFCGSDDFLVINSDNYYPAEALHGLRSLKGAGLAVFDRDAMIAGSNITADRISKFAAVEVTAAGHLKTIHEKPSEELLARLGDPIFCSMNCWRFSRKLFDACRAIPLSARGEYEITDAAQYCIDKLGEPFVALKYQLPVLDMSSRGDIGPVAERLGKVKVDY